MNMKTKSRILLVCFCSILTLGPLAGQGKKNLKDLDPRYRQWLEEEVVYIVTDKERDIFLRLDSDKQRDIFIEAFWKQRDPTPGTPQNEFREEHYRRLTEADRIYGRGTPRPGRKTDMGKITIILGKPLDVEKYEGESFVYPSEIWSYKGEEQYGLPAYFRLVFFKEKGAGEYKLYSPLTDGMESLIIDKNIAAADPEKAYYELFRFDAELAQASLTLIPDEQAVPGNPSLASEALLGSVAGLPQKKVDDEYAAKLLSYKDVVEVDYTANYISSDHLLSLLQDERGVYFLHFSIEPSSLSVDSYQDKYVAHFELNVKVDDAGGKTIFQYGKSFPLELSQGSIDQLRNASYALQDAFPLIPGSYSLNVILKNTISKEFTTVEEKILVPPADGSLAMSRLLLGYKVEKNPNFLTQKKPFVAEDYQIFAQPKKIFSRQDRLAVYFQVYHLSPALAGGRMKYVIFGETKEWVRETQKLEGRAADKNFLREFPLTDYPPGFYKVRAAVCNERDEEVLFEEKEFQVTPLPSVARPWIISKVMPVNRNSLAEIDFMLANQYWASGNPAQAGAILEKCLEQAFQPRYALRLAELLLAQKNYQRVKALLQPLKAASPDSPQALVLLGRAHQALGEFQEAADNYREYLVRSGTNLEILNTLGECYFQMGSMDQALVAWEKSLELNPAQPELKKKVEGLKKK